MIYPYTPFEHQVQKFHKGIYYFFDKLFEFEPSTFDKSVLFQPDFLPLIKSSKTRLEDPLKAIWKAYIELVDINEKVKVKNAFINNNKIEELCKGELTPYKFIELHEDIRKPIYDFWDSLWEGFTATNTSLNSKVYNLCGEVINHFREFKEQPFQKTRICPFCGIHGLKTIGDNHRNAYDHYLPKSRYPFTAVNFENAIPICHECNSDAKKAIDILYNETGRRKIFYPFDQTINPEQLAVNIYVHETYNINSTLLKNINWEYVLSINNANDERLNSWDSIFNIKERFQNHLIDFEDEWFIQLFNRFRKYNERGIAFNEFKNEILEETKSQILTTEKGILKHSYFSFLLNEDEIEKDFIALL